MTDTPVEGQTDPEEIVVDPISPGTPSGLFEGQLKTFKQSKDPNSAIQQSGPISGHTKKTTSTGIAFSGGGIRSAAFCSGALRRMLQDDVPMEYLSCVSGGGYTGAAFVEWKRRPKPKPKPTNEEEEEEEEITSEKDWQKIFFEEMRDKAGYMCNWESPCFGIWHSVVFIALLILVVFILPCALWLPYALPIAVFVDVIFGGILRENSTCPPSVNMADKTSFLIMELYDNCHPPGRRLALFLITFGLWILFFVLSRIEKLVKIQNLFRFLSIINGLVLAFTLLPWVAHDFLWPLRTWVKALVFIACLVVPFFVPIVRNVAAIFLFFYTYTLFVSWRVFKTELLGALPYSDDVFYPFLMGCAITLILFPVIGSLHQSLFNIYYRYRLSKAFFRKPAQCRFQDCFPGCGRSVKGITNFVRGKGFTPVYDEDIADRELTLQDLDGISPTFISNITVNNWQIDSEAESCHQLISFSSEGVKLIGVDVKDPPDEESTFGGRFKPEHMRLSAAMAISGAAVSFHMGSYETGLDRVLDLLNLLGIGMGDEMVSNQCLCQKQKNSTTGKIIQHVLPLLVEFCCLLPLIVSPFVYWLGHSKQAVDYLVFVHVIIVVVLTALAMVPTGSPAPGRWQRFIGWWIKHIFYVRFIRGFLSIKNIGKHPPAVLRLSDGGHFENLALLPLLDKKLEKIVIFDGSCAPSDEKYAESLLTALKLAREKLHCSFVGKDGRDINEDIRKNFLKMKSKRRPRSYEFRVEYYDEDGTKKSTGEILFVAPRHPSHSMPLAERQINEEPKPWSTFDVELGDPDHNMWGKSPELTDLEADRLTFCCCNCCHYYGSSHCISDALLGRFPHHITANQFFSPDTFSAYHREGYAACVEAKVAKFLKKQPTQDS